MKEKIFGGKLIKFDIQKLYNKKTKKYAKLNLCEKFTSLVKEEKRKKLRNQQAPQIFWGKHSRFVKMQQC